MKLRRIKNKLETFLKNRINVLKRPPKVMLIDETIRYILEHQCSVSRFGDGELWVILGGTINYQKKDVKLQQRLIEVLSSDEIKNNHIVTIPDIFEDDKLALRTDKNQIFWRKHLLVHRKDWYTYLKSGKLYFNTAISRFYMPIKDKEKSKIYIELLKKIWENREIVIVEGEKSRLGAGNDLFEKCKSISRILCPPENAFDQYEQILTAVQKVEKDKLILIALGPTATVMAYDLHKLGYWAIDIGHIDIEYEWFKMGVLEPVKIETKYTNESKGGTQDILDVKDEYYQKQIIARID